MNNIYDVYSHKSEKYVSDETNEMDVPLFICNNFVNREVQDKVDFLFALLPVRQEFPFLPSPPPKKPLDTVLKRRVLLPGRRWTSLSC